jgi:hypothetical protein
MANYCIRWHGIFKGLSQDGGRAEFSKKPLPPLSLMTTYQMSLISAGSIWQDSTFKTAENNILAKEQLAKHI